MKILNGGIISSLSVIIYWVPPKRARVGGIIRYIVDDLVEVVIFNTKNSENT